MTVFLFTICSGVIDKEELKSLLIDTMPKKMSEMMIKRYVDMQFQLYDKDSSGAISLDEFLLLYENVYIHGNQGVRLYHW